MPAAYLDRSSRAARNSDERSEQHGLHLHGLEAVAHISAEQVLLVDLAHDLERAELGRGGGDGAFGVEGELAQEMLATSIRQRSRDAMGMCTVFTW